MPQGEPSAKLPPSPGLQHGARSCIPALLPSSGWPGRPMTVNVVDAPHVASSGSALATVGMANAFAAAATIAAVERSCATRLPLGLVEIAPP